MGLRPSARFPTLEMRVTDVCTRIEDAVCVAAMYVASCACSIASAAPTRRWRTYPPFLLAENRWRAQRYGVRDGTLFDFGKGELVPFRDLVDELLVLLARTPTLSAAPRSSSSATIVTHGTSADRQLAASRR